MPSVHRVRRHLREKRDRTREEKAYIGEDVGCWRGCTRSQGGRSLKDARADERVDPALAVRRGSRQRSQQQVLRQRLWAHGRGTWAPRGAVLTREERRGKREERTGGRCGAGEGGEETSLSSHGARAPSSQSAPPCWPPRTCRPADSPDK